MTNVPTIKEMTKKEREALVKLIRQRERLAKTTATERSKTLMADFEQQADRIYSYDEDAVWKKVVETANEEVNKAAEKIADRCRELGIPQTFAPTFRFIWQQQRAAIGYEREKMRQVAKRRIEQIEASARTAIERASVAAQEALLIGGLDTDAAKYFLESMPSVDEMMPQINMADLQQALIEERPLRRGFGAIGYDDEY